MVQGLVCELIRAKIDNMAKLHKHHKSTLLKARQIKALADRYYEAGNQRRCLKGIYARYIYPLYPMCYHTFLKYLKIASEEELNEVNANSKTERITHVLFNLFDEFPY